MGNSFLTRQPANALRNFIESYNLIELTGTPETEPFEQKPLTNGCVQMFIGYHGTINTCYTNSGSIIFAESALIGAHNLNNVVKSKVLDAEPRYCKFVSINFKLNGFYGIFKIPSSELFNGFFESNHVIGSDLNQLIAQLNDAKDLTERKANLDLFFIKQLNKNSFKHYNIRAGFDIANLIRHCKGNIKVEQLANEFKITARTLQRDLKTAIGLTPKEFCKIIRFSNLINYVSTQHDIDWFDMVSQFGYYDQAHLINEFKSAIGLTPDLYLKQQNKSIFKIYNHIVSFKPNIIYSEIQASMTEAEASYTQNIEHEF